MNYIFTIDTLQFSRRLQTAGLEAKIADEIAEVIKDTQAQSIEGLATKQDIREVKQEIKYLDQKIDALDQKFEQKFNAVEQRIDALDQKFEQKFNAVEQRIDALDQKFEQRFTSFDQKFETLEYKLTVKIFVAMIAAVSIITWLDRVLN
ncbi:MAG: hypothetical protein FJX34_01865 [Alphaproteobacteria bacterium]|nr:hypothetical protein [Alphaproteobacteria bacterium]